MCSYEISRKLKELLLNVMFVETEAEKQREILGSQADFEPLLVFHRIAGSAQKDTLYNTDIQKLLKQNKINESRFACGLLIKRYAQTEYIPVYNDEDFDGYNIKFLEFLDIVMPFTNTHIRQEIALRKPRCVESLLPYSVERPLSDLLDFLARSLVKLDQIKMQLAVKLRLEFDNRPSKSSSSSSSSIKQNKSPPPPQKQSKEAINMIEMHESCFSQIDCEKIGFIDRDSIQNFLVRQGAVISDLESELILRGISKSNSTNRAYSSGSSQQRVSLEEFSDFLTHSTTPSTRSATETSGSRAESSIPYQSDFTRFYTQKYHPKHNLLASPPAISSYIQQSEQLIQNFSASASSSSSLRKPTSQSYVSPSRNNHSNMHTQQNQSSLTSPKSKVLQANYVSPRISQYQSQRLELLGSPNRIISTSLTGKPLQGISLGENSYLSPKTQQLGQLERFQTTKTVTTHSSEVNGVAQPKNPIIKKFLKGVMKIVGLEKEVEGAKLDFLAKSNFGANVLFDYYLHRAAINNSKKEDTQQQQQQGLFRKWENLVGSEFKAILAEDLCFSEEQCAVLFRFFDNKSTGQITKQAFVERITPADPFLETVNKHFTQVQELTQLEKGSLKEYFDFIIEREYEISQLKAKFESKAIGLSAVFNALCKEDSMRLSRLELSQRFEEAEIAVSEEDLHLIVEIFKRNTPQTRMPLMHIDFFEFLSFFSSSTRSG